MVESTIYVRNKTGLHLRPASELSQLCAKMKSDITIEFGDKILNPKSVLLLMGAGIKQGSKITIKVEGENEEADLKAIEDMINSGFGEEMVSVKELEEQE